MSGLTALDFFAGSGLVRVGLEPHFRTVWANDIDPRKATVYRANSEGNEFQLAPIEDVRGGDLPRADLAWASFPCQDLSLAGNLHGMRRGTRSGLFWHWIRVLDEMAEAGKRPPIVVAENVVGFLVAGDGAHVRAAYRALRARGYLAGAVVVDARTFLPQSRPRAFLIGVAEGTRIDGLTMGGPSEPFHPAPVVRAAAAARDTSWTWWSLPMPGARVPPFASVCERDAPSEPVPGDLLNMLSPTNKAKLEAALKSRKFLAGTGYRRARPNEAGVLQQRLELRFDGVAGCLRTPEGGSSRQIVLLVDRGEVRYRLLTVRECARLMGAPDDYRVPGSYNDGYRAMGDAVAVPVTRFLAQDLLAPLARRRGVLAAAS
jgi:DNA (cytosine-5)-methyltransferase 1